MAPGAMMQGETVYVYDGSCPRNQIREVIGGNQGRNVPRLRRCIPLD